MPCEIAYFHDNDKYTMTLFFLNFYISLIIIITVLIFINTAYNYYVYNNIVSENLYNDTNVIEKGNLPPKTSELSNNKILIGETIDYKLFISLFIDQNMYYNDKYFTLNITNILLDVFMLATIVIVVFSIIYYSISKISAFAKSIKLELDIEKLKEYIFQYCYFINNNNCESYHIYKMILVGIVFLILLIIYILRRSMIPSINYTDYLDNAKSKDNNIYGKINIENMLNLINVHNNDNDDDLIITKIIDKLNGHNIHTVNIIPTGDYKITDEDFNEADKVPNKTDNQKIELFILKIKIISEKIKAIADKDNKDLDFVKLVLVYLNNKKIYNNNKKIQGNIAEVARTYLQSLLNILANVIPYSVFGSFKTNNYDIENILIGAFPLQSKGDIKDKPTNTCTDEFDNFDNFKSNIKESQGCFYRNYLFKLNKTSTKLKESLKGILISSILSIIFILILFYYIYINYNIDNMRCAKTTAIKMMRSITPMNPLTWVNWVCGHIIHFLNNNN